MSNKGDEGKGEGTEKDNGKAQFTLHDAMRFPSIHETYMAPHSATQPITSLNRCNHATAVHSISQKRIGELLTFQFPLYVYLPDRH